jgi:hypothetical protein
MSQPPAHTGQARAVPREAPSSRRQGVGKLQSRQRSLPVLVVAMLLTILAMAVAAYLGVRASALNTAQERLGQDAQIAGEIVAERGQYASLQGDKLVVGVGDATYTLSNDTYVVDHIRDVTGDETVVYRLQGTSLIAVASTFRIPGSDGHTDAPARQLGDPLTGSAHDAVLGHCSAEAPAAACRGRYSGIVTLHGQSMVAGFVPLLDMNGKLVGAVGVARPLDDLLRMPLQLVIVLAFVGLLVGLVALVVGMWILSLRSERVVEDLDERLEAVAGSASQVQQLAQAHAVQAQRQDRTARQVSELAHELERLVGGMEREQKSLRRSATDIWAEMSQPGLAPNPATALHLARESAVAAARLGATTDEIRARGRRLINLMNQLMAEGRALADEGQETGQRAHELRQAIADVEMALGDRVTEQRYDLPGLSFVRRATSRRLGARGWREEPVKPAGAPPQAPRMGTGQYPSLGNTGGHNRAQPGGTGVHRATPGQRRNTGIHPLYHSGQVPSVHPDSGAAPSVQPPRATPRPNAGMPPQPPRQAGKGGTGSTGSTPPPRPPAGGPWNSGRHTAGPGKPPARPPQGDDSQPGRNDNDSRWLND